MERRDLKAAGAMLADGFQMVFPGTAPMSTLSELIDWARTRYTFVKKTIDDVETYHLAASAVVFVRGTLAGEWPDGTGFQGIRFIDRFEVIDHKIAQQDVWNDLGEVRPK